MDKEKKLDITADTFSRHSVSIIRDLFIISLHMEHALSQSWASELMIRADEADDANKFLFNVFSTGVKKLGRPPSPH